MKLALLLFALLAALPASAKPGGLLPVGSRPPDIAGTDADGKTHHVRDLVNKKRVVLLLGSNAAYTENVHKHRAQFAERDLLVLSAAGGAPAFYLVGKDGLIKMAQRTPPANAALFTTIDAMPMRQAEMRERK